MKILFAGPSLSADIDEIRKRHPQFDIRPPAVCGDVTRAVLDGATVIGLVDGCFEQLRSVWHKEILYALSKGTVVAGAASMGALRAAECHDFGMIGIGKVFESYASGELIDDSDVALVHAPSEMGYRAFSQPRVNILATIGSMRDTGLLSFCEWRSAETACRRQHYTELSVGSVINVIPDIDDRRRQALVDWAKAYPVDIKRSDALQLVDWLEDQPDRLGAIPDWKFGETAQWRTLFSEVTAEWKAGRNELRH